MLLLRRGGDADHSAIFPPDALRLRFTKFPNLALGDGAHLHDGTGLRGAECVDDTSATVPVAMNNATVLSARLSATQVALDDDYIEIWTPLS